MATNIYIANRLREVFLNGTWIANTNYQEQVTHINWKDATKGIEGLNSIADLTFHIDYYLAGLSQVLGGGVLEIRDKYSFDVPEIKSQADWDSLVNQFLLNVEKFAAAVEQMGEEQFEQPFVEAKYGTYLRNLEGVIEHSYYHLGQIVLIKKLLAARS